MFSIRIQEASHQKLKKVSKYLFLTVFAVVSILAIVKTFSDYFEAKALLKDYSVVEAALTFEGVTEKRKRKGRIATTYHFNYEFEFDGQVYSHQFETSESNSDKYMDKDTLTIAVDNNDHQHFDVLADVERHADLGDGAAHIAWSVLIFAVGAFLIHMLLTRRLFTVREETASA